MMLILFLKGFKETSLEIKANINQNYFSSTILKYKGHIPEGLQGARRREETEKFDGGLWKLIEEKKKKRNCIKLK